MPWRSFPRELRERLVEANRAVVSLDDLFGNAEPQTKAAYRCIRGINPIKLFKDLARLRGVKTDPFVGNDTFETTGVEGAADGDSPPVRGVLDRIAQ